MSKERCTLIKLAFWNCLGGSYVSQGKSESWNEGLDASCTTLSLRADAPCWAAIEHSWFPYISHFFPRVILSLLARKTFDSIKHNCFSQAVRTFDLANAAKPSSRWNAVPGPHVWTSLKLCLVAYILWHMSYPGQLRKQHPMSMQHFSKHCFSSLQKADSSNCKCSEPLCSNIICLIW